MVCVQILKLFQLHADRSGPDILLDIGAGAKQQLQYLAYISSRV